MGILLLYVGNEPGELIRLLGMGVALVGGTICGTIVAATEIKAGAGRKRRAMIQGVLMGLVAGVPGGVLGGLGRHLSVMTDAKYSYDWEDLKNNDTVKAKEKGSPEEKHAAFQQWAREHEAKNAAQSRPRAIAEGILTALGLLLACVVSGALAGAGSGNAAVAGPVKEHE